MKSRKLTKFQQYERDLDRYFSKIPARVRETYRGWQAWEDGYRAGYRASTNKRRKA